MCMLTLQGVQDDIQTLQHNVKSINSIVKTFMDDCDPDFKVWLRAIRVRMGKSR